MSHMKTVKDVTEEYIANGSPGTGEIAYEKNYDKGRHYAEIKNAQWLLECFGGRIKLLTERNENHILTPDYEWNGKL